MTRRNADDYRACAAEGLSTSEAAKRLGLSPSAVSCAAKRHGLTFRDARAERMRRLHADPLVNQLAAMTPEQRADYDLLKKAGYSRAEAFAAMRFTPTSGEDATP